MILGRTSIGTFGCTSISSTSFRNWESARPIVLRSIGFLVIAVTPFLLVFRCSGFISIWCSLDESKNFDVFIGCDIASWEPDFWFRFSWHCVVLFLWPYDWSISSPSSSSVFTDSGAIACSTFGCFLGRLYSLEGCAADPANPLLRGDAFPWFLV